MWISYSRNAFKHVKLLKLRSFERRPLHSAAAAGLLGPVGVSEVPGVCVLETWLAVGEGIQVCGLL